ncbi:MAG: class I SAM-dependent rRNA methyltransferase [Chitinophagales bacterium]|nr:class I SAM-dependent rRNA methyltransferase [Chitinophagales bacterium]
MDLKKAVLNKGKHLRIINGHPWIYANEIASLSATPEPGEIVDVVDIKNHFIGRGFYNEKSQITIRLLTRNQNEQIDEAFFRRKIKSCIAYRKQLGYNENFRLVFGEGDFIPALVIDKFGPYFVLQALALGIDKWKEVIAKIIKEEFPVQGIYERNDVPVRKLEGLEEQKGFLSETFNTKIEITENGVRLMMDIENGQKTGFFLDQKDNREALKYISGGAEVLDCFCYTGSFSLFALKFGAHKVIGLDASESAISQARENALLNNFSNCEFKVANAFDQLPLWVKEHKIFDVVILDPPAFTKNRSGIESAIRGYKEINLRAMRLIRSGGFLVTFSCSHFIDPSMFFELVSQAAADAGKTIRQVSYLSQSKDHPIVWNIDETNYLKGFVLQIL